MATARDQHTAVISAKGQIVLPSAILDQRRWRAGMRLTVESTLGGVLLKPAPLFPASTVDAVFGSLGYAGDAKAIEEMDAAIAAEATRLL